MYIHILIHRSFLVSGDLSYRARDRAICYGASHGRSLQYRRGHRRGLAVYISRYVYLCSVSYWCQFIFPIVRVIAQSAMAPVMTTA